MISSIGHRQQRLTRWSTPFGRTRSIALAFAVAVTGGAGLARAETLTDALISAYNHSNLLDQNRALLRVVDEDVAIAVAALRPIVSYAASAGATFTNFSVASTRVSTNSLSASVTLSADLTLYDFGRSQLGINLAGESVLATREALIGVEQNVLLSAVQAYMSVIQASEFVALRQNNLRVIGQELRAAQDRFELGEVTRTDVSLAEARLAQSRASLAAAEGDLATAREGFKLAVGHYPGSLRNPPAAPRTAKTRDQAGVIAQKTHPSIRQAQREVTIGEIQIAIAKAAMKPVLSGGVRSTLQDGGTTSTGLSLDLRGPIYQGGALSARYRQASARSEASRAALLQTTAIVAQNVGNAWSQLSVAAAQLDASERQIRAARVAFRGMQEEATLGARTTLDVLNAEQELLDAEANRIAAYTNQYFQTYVVLREMGLLTVEHLGLGIPTFDPSAYYNTVRTAPVTNVSPQGQKLDRILKGLGKN